MKKCTTVTLKGVIFYSFTINSNYCYTPQNSRAQATTNLNKS